MTVAGLLPDRIGLSNKRLDVSREAREGEWGENGRLGEMEGE